MNENEMKEKLLSIRESYRGNTRCDCEPINEKQGFIEREQKKDLTIGIAIIGIAAIIIIAVSSWAIQDANKHIDTLLQQYKITIDKK